MSDVRSMVGRAVNFLRKVVPPSLVPLVVLIRAHIARLRPAVWTDAQAQMRFVVGDDQPDAAIRRLAAAYLRRMIWRGESRFHPPLVARQQVVGVEHLRALQDAGTGFLVTFAHHGDYEGLPSSLARAGIANHVIATSEMFAEEMPGWMRQQREVVAFEAGVTMLDVAEGSAGIKKALAGGHPVCMAVDVVGSTPIRFLGHDLHLASGGARISFASNVPVVMVTAHRNPTAPGSCATLKVAAPLHPDEFAAPEDMLEAMVRHHELAILTWPEASEYPERRFAGTTAH
jgi:lauroyl/myristoyl acyltransferase